MSVIPVSKKYSALIENAHDLFWRFGFRKVTVEDVCKQAKVSKMTFYKFFPDKLTLAKEVYRLEVEKSIVSFRKIMHSQDSVSEKLAAIIRSKSESARNISQEFLHDFYTDEYLGLKQFVNQLTNDSWFEIEQLFKEAQLKGEFRKDFNPAFFLFISQKIGDFISDPYLIKLCGGSHEAVMELTRIFTWGIAPRDLNDRQ